jgi:colicin import membrane protein
MENRPLPVAALLSLLLAVPFAALAADAGQDASWQERLGRSAAMQDESKRLQSAASQRRDQKFLDCEQKFLVNDCRDEASKEYLQTTREARRLEIDGKSIERAVKKEELEANRQHLADEAPRREAALREREAETAAARQSAAQKAEAARTDKARQAVDGERRKAREAERLRKKQAAHDARVATQKREAEQRAARARPGK